MSRDARDAKAQDAKKINALSSFAQSPRAVIFSERENVATPG